MEDNEIKDILRATRPQGQDADDSSVVEAEALAAKDPHLSAWLEKERAFDRAFAAKLRDVPVPEGLKERLLAQKPEPEASAQDTRQGDLRANVMPLLALVAALAVIVGLGFVLTPQQNTTLASSEAMPFATFKEKAMAVFGPGFKLSLATSDIGQMRSWLAAHGGARSFSMPPGLSGQEGVGCRIVEMGDHTASLICFRLDNGKTAHLFAMPEKYLADAPQAPVTDVDKGWMTSAWSSNGMTYMLAVNDTNVNALRDVFPGTFGTGTTSL